MMVCAENGESNRETGEMEKASISIRKHYCPSLNSIRYMFH